MKKFDINKALDGDPVILRGGSKAFIYCIIPNHVRTLMPEEPYVLVGGEFDPQTNDCINSLITWTKNGNYIDDNDESFSDIVGMWSSNDGI